ncbi:MAG TPA: hypothetical protein VH988_04075 [Thermoanaerobaculia bacterium]|nr:hypothetical protein [Thermoanaerobaculia bacterium]
MINGVTEVAVVWLSATNYRSINDFERAARFFDTLYASNRLKLPLEGCCSLGTDCLGRLRNR